MGTVVYGLSASTFADLPTAGELGLISQLNAALAALLTSYFTGFSFMAQESQRGTGYDLATEFVYTTGQTAIATPYQAQGFYARTAESLAKQVNDFIALNPTYWYSGVYAIKLDAPRRDAKIVGIVFFNTVYANGSQNWGLINADSSGTGPVGPAGGDLGGTYPNPVIFIGQVVVSPPASLTTLDTVPVASFRSVEWFIQAWKAGTTTAYTSTLSATSDGTTPAYQENGVAIQPPSGGTFDFAYSVAISGGNLLLQVTPLTTGWVFTLRRTSELAP